MAGITTSVTPVTGLVAGMLVGTLSAVGLTLVSPNLTYPIAATEAAQKVLAAEPAKLEG